MIAQYTPEAFGSVSSAIPWISLSEGSSTVMYRSIYVVGHVEVRPDFRIERDFLIDSPSLMNSAKVLYSFYIKVQRIQGEFIATSDVSDVYEAGDTPKQAILNYLYSLVDELLWFQEQKETLSKSMLKEFEKLQFYLGLV